MAVFQECFVLPEKGFMASCRSCQHANSRNRRASSLGGRQDRGGGAGRARPIVSRPASRANYHSVGSGNYDQLKGRDVGSCARCSLSFRSIADSARFMAMPGRTRLHSPLCVLPADPELETVQVRVVGRPDYEGYTLVHHAALGRHAEGVSGFGNHENAICGSKPDQGVPDTTRREG